MMIKTFSTKPTTESFRPQSGIDKIKVMPIQNLVNVPKFESAVRINNPYTLFPGDNRLCLEKAGDYCLVIVNQEFFDFSASMLCQIGVALFILMLRGFLVFSKEAFYNPLFFISHITEVEFYFDHKICNCFVLPERTTFSIEAAKTSKMFYKYADGGIPTDTYYSWDFDSQKGRKSTVTIYNKEQADLASVWRGNGLSVSEQQQRIMQHPYKIRTEYRLNRNNCDFLYPYNFQGDYRTVLGRYKEFLAVMHNKYFSKNIFYKTRTNNEYDRVVRCAKTANQIRFTNGSNHLLKG